MTSAVRRAATDMTDGPILPLILRFARRKVNQVQHFPIRLRQEFSSRDIFWDGC